MKKDYKIIASTNKETHDLENADDSHTTPFTTENVQTTAAIHEENTTQGGATAKDMQSSTLPRSTTKTATHGTATTEGRDIEKTTPTLRFTKSNFENSEEPGNL